MNSQFAAFILELVNAAPTRGADAENVAAAKNWLKQIQQGQLVVGAPVPPETEKPA